MEILNIEIKASTDNAQNIRQILLGRKAQYKGIDHQIDTYFLVDSGRLKLRQGNIENSLIRYHRIETEGLKKSEVVLQRLPDDVSGLKQILIDQIGVWKIVDKQREIYFIENVKFHIDNVIGLGSFIEVEAISHGEYSEDHLKQQCQLYVDLFEIKAEQMIAKSYSDMVK